MTDDKTGLVEFGLEARKLALPDIVKKHIETHGQVDGYLAGINGNAYAIMGHVNRLLSRGGWPRQAREDVIELMRAHDYNHLLCVAMSVLIDPLTGMEEFENFREAIRAYTKATGQE